MSRNRTGENWRDRLTDLADRYPGAAERIAQAAINIGEEALKGTGVVKTGRRGGLRLRPIGAIRAAISPTSAIRRGATAAGRELRSQAVGAGFDAAAGAITSRNQQGTPQSHAAEYRGSSEDADWTTETPDQHYPNEAANRDNASVQSDPYRLDQAYGTTRYEDWL